WYSRWPAGRGPVQNDLNALALRISSKITAHGRSASAAPIRISSPACHSNSGPTIYGSDAQTAAAGVLQIEHVIVCSHYGCSGVSAALQNKRVGLVENWLRTVQEVQS